MSTIPDDEDDWSITDEDARYLARILHEVHQRRAMQSSPPARSEGEGDAPSSCRD